MNHKKSFPKNEEKNIAESQKWLKSIIASKAFRIGIQIVAWLCFYAIWRISTWRYFSDPQHERYSFFLIPLGVYLFYFLAFKNFYRKGKIKAFLCSSLLICILIICMEYFYVIDTIIGHIPTDNPGIDYQESKQYTQKETLLDISLRDFALFAIVGFGLLYKDSFQYNKLLKSQVNHLQEKERLQKEIQSYRSHCHFTQDMLKVYQKDHPDSWHDIQEYMDLYQYSYEHNSCVTYALDKEVAFAKRLTAFYQKHFPDTPISFICPQQIPPVYIPPLITEPLISNMFKHGITGPQGGMSVEFDFSKSPEWIQIRFRNKISDPTTVFNLQGCNGLSFLAKKLALIYREEASLKYDIQDQTCTFILSIRP